jgi:hypothetical protein
VHLGRQFGAQLLDERSDFLAYLIKAIGVASSTLHRRMHDRKLLLSTERRGGEKRLTARKTIGGKRRQVLHVAHSLAPYPSQPGPTGPTDPDDQED